MPHYYFHLREAAHVSRDGQGADLPSGKEARSKAMRTARDVVCKELLEGEPLNLEREYEITDDDGMGVMTVTFTMALGARRLDGPNH